MGFEEFLPKEEETEIIPSENINEIEKISPIQVYEVITSKKPDWQTIIYDLIHSEQLDPWDIDLVILTKKYFEKIIEFEQNLDFYASSKVLLAASLLLRIKSEFLLNKHIKSIDEILFGKKQEQKQIFEKIEINEDDLPFLTPKTPLSRLRRVTLPELMQALNKAINTESRRIKREVAIKRAHKLSYVDIPQFKRIDLKDRIKQFYAKILTALKKPQPKPINKIGYSKLIGEQKEQRLACFLPLLHLSNNKKLWLEQETHLDEIWIFLYQYFKKNKDQFIEELEEDIEEMKKELEDSEINNQTENITGENLTGLEKARQKQKQKKELQEQIAKELEQELGQEINKEISQIQNQEDIEDVSGFEDE